MRYKFLILSTLAICASSQAFCLDALMFRGNPEHSGVYTAAGVPKGSQIKWKFHTDGKIISSPALANGVVFVGSTDQYLYAVEQESGKLKWKFATKGRVNSSPAVADGIVYFGAYDGTFYAVDASTGKLKWKFQTGGERRFAATHLHGSQPATETMPDPFDCYLSSPVLFQGAVYFGSGDGNVYSLNAGSGALNWKFKTGDVVHASPAIAGGKLFIGSWDSYFYALDAATGKEQWRFKTGEDADTHNQVGIQSSAAVVDGLVYFGCRDSHMYVLDAHTGQQKWTLPTKASWVITSPAVRNGKVYVATSDSGLFYVLDAKSGAIDFSVKFMGWPTFASPAVAGDMVYVGSTSGKLSAVDLTSKSIAWTFDTDGSKQNGAALTKSDGTPNYEAAFDSDFYDDIMAGYVKMLEVGAILSSPVVEGNAIYFGSTDGNLYALM